MTSDLERRIARIEAREAIRELVFDYSTAVDDRDYDRIGEIFCDDATFAHADGRDATEGRDAIVDFYRYRTGLMGPTYHYPHSHRIDFDDDDNATGTVLAHAELALEGTTYQVGLRYADTYRRRNGAWLFGSRTVCFLYFMPLSELVDGGLGAPDRKRYPDVGPVAADLPETLATWRAAKGLD